MTTSLYPFVTRPFSLSSALRAHSAAAQELATEVWGVLRLIEALQQSQRTEIVELSIDLLRERVEEKIAIRLGPLSRIKGTPEWYIHREFERQFLRSSGEVKGAKVIPFPTTAPFAVSSDS